MINANTLKHGITFKENEKIFVVLEASCSKQGRGQANVKVKVKNLRTGSIVIKTFTSGYKVKMAHILKKKMKFLYKDELNIYLMDNESFEQLEIPINKIKWELNFLKEGNEVLIRKYDEEILGIELPINIKLKVIEAPNAIKGNTQSNPQKKVKLETGFEIEAPMFIKEKENIIVSSETGKYVGRAEK